MRHTNGRFLQPLRDGGLREVNISLPAISYVGVRHLTIAPTCGLLHLDLYTTRTIKDQSTR